MTKQNEKLSTDVGNLLRDKDRMTQEIGQLQEEVLELKEQVNSNM